MTQPEARVMGLTAVVLAGGSGTRLWPLSRQAHPKHLLPIAPDGRSLLRHAFDRASRLGGRVLVVTAHEQERAVLDELPELPPTNILLEPEPRGTGPALAWAALRALRDEPEAVIISLHADHYLADELEATRVLRAAASWAAAGEWLICVGVKPRWAATGFGYLELGDAIPGAGQQRGAAELRRALSFVEKPELNSAEAMVASGRWLWNTGMFAWSARLFLEELQRHAPDTAAAVRAADASASDFGQLWSRVPTGVVDRLVLEQSDRVAALAVDTSWRDLGSFRDLFLAAQEGGGAGNSGSVLSGDVLELHSGSNYVRAEAGRTVVLLGVDELAVVDSGGVVLVCPLSEAQRVSEVVGRLRQLGRSSEL